MQLRTLVKERDELKEVVDDYKISIAEMELELELPKQEYIEKYAREVLGYHKHSDIIFEEKTNWTSSKILLLTIHAEYIII